MTRVLISEDVTSKTGPGTKGKLRRASSVSAVPGLDKVSHHEEKWCWEICLKMGKGRSKRETDTPTSIAESEYTSSGTDW